MLKGIPEILSPELLKVLCEMGHSDRLVIADGNFPVESMGKNAITIRCDGHGVPEILEAILKVFPLDTYVEHPVNLMEVMPGDTVETPIWDTYKEIIRKYDDRGDAVVVVINYFIMAIFSIKSPELLLFGAFFHVMMKTESEINFTEDMI